MANTNGSSIVVGSGERVPSWEELLGSNKWQGLLDPLDLTLRRFLLRCGDLCECAYDAFNGDTTSPYYGTSRYGEKSFFKKLKFEFADDYDVSCLLYATSTDLLKSKETYFMGYVAVSNDAASELLGRREIYVVWRGTRTTVEIFDDLECNLVPATALHPSDPPMVMNGWVNIYTSSNPSSELGKLSARDQLLTKIKQLVRDYRDENFSIVLTGHSLGGALAELSAFDLLENGVVGADVPVAAVVFASPRVGAEAGFVKRVEGHRNLNILQTRNKNDKIPDSPPDWMGYCPAGEQMQIDGSKSPWIKKIGGEFLGWHNLQGMLHVVAGWHGQDKPFKLAVKRSLALVNKSSDLLNDDCKIPENWWAVENKGMVLTDKGDWVLAPPLQED